MIAYDVYMPDENNPRMYRLVDTVFFKTPHDVVLVKATLVRDDKYPDTIIVKWRDNG